MGYLQKGKKLQALEYFKRYLSLKEKDLSPEEKRKIEALIIAPTRELAGQI